MESSDQEFLRDILTNCSRGSPEVVSYLSYQAGILCCISVDSITTMSEVSSSLRCHVTHLMPHSQSPLLTQYFTSCYPISRKLESGDWCLCTGLSLGSLCTVYREIFHWCRQRIRTEESRARERAEAQPGRPGDTGESWEADPALAWTHWALGQVIASPAHSLLL